MAKRQDTGILEARMKKSVARKSKWAFWAGMVLWLVFLVEHLPVLQGHEIMSLDYVSRLRQPRSLDRSGIVLVSIDSDDFKNIFQSQSPLNPDKVIQTIQKIATAQPRVIAVALDTSKLRYHDLNLQSILRTGVPIVWAREARLPGEKPGSNLPFTSGSAVIPGVVLGGAESPEGNFFTGISNLFEDDGAVRRYKWLFKADDGHYRDSFCLAVLKIICSGSSSSKPGPRYCQLVDKSVNDPESRLNPAFIRFSMDPPHHLLTVGDLQRLSPRASAPQDWQTYLKGKIVFLGGEFPEGFDRYPTAVGDHYGVRIHAEALASQMENETIWVRSRWWVILAEVAALCALFIAQHRINKAASRFWCIFCGMILFSILLSYFSFGRWELFYNFVPLLAGIFLDVVKDLAWQQVSSDSAISKSADV
jgi:CHASE2 domain-containing sensor protein